MLDYLKIDKEYIWHPFTQAKLAPEPIPIVKAKGLKLYDLNGKEYLDLISSWWVNLHGHCHPYIANKIAEQAHKLEHVIFAGFTHDSAINLVNELNSYIDPKLRKYFFSDNGSTSVEIAIKMAYQHWRNLGQTNRYKFIAFEGGYHGDTVGSMSIGSSSGYFNVFSDLVFQADYLPYPYTWLNDEDVEEKEHHAYKKLQYYLEEFSQDVVALIIEPLMQGASGMRLMRAEFLSKIVNLARSYGVVIIFDEVMTGFGRTGTMFAYEQSNIVPDILCLSKGLTGGFLPMALTITTDHIYNSFLSDDIAKTFMHGHSYTANPLGCAASIASLELFKKENTLEKIKSIEKWHHIYLNKMAINLEQVSKIRICGTIAAFEITSPKTDINYLLKEKFWQNGLLIRPLGNQIYLIPPYCITEDEIKYTYEQMEKIIHNIPK